MLCNIMNYMMALNLYGDDSIVGTGLYFVHLNSFVN